MSPRGPALIALAAALATAPALRAAPQGGSGPPLVPEAFEVAPIVTRALDAPYLSPSEKSDLRVFHGVWDERDLNNPERRARAAVASWHLDDPSLSDPSVSLAVRAKARLMRGRMQEALDLLAGADDPESSAMRAQALETLGRYGEALKAAAPAIKAGADASATPAQLVAAAAAMALKARIEGQPARDWQAIMDILGRAREKDRAYWPAMVEEARLLEEKDNPVDAVLALHQALGLNPRSVDAWSILGRFALTRFDFDGARRAADAIRRLDLHHPAADLLEASSSITQNDPDRAEQLLDPLLSREPMLADALALRAAADAVRYNAAGCATWLARLDEISPKSAAGEFEVGRCLSQARQYEDAATHLEEAVKRRPAWAQPQIELGLLEMQAGRPDRARTALTAVSKLDPFNKRCSFSLYLLDEMAGWKTFEGEHFIVRCRPGIDEVVAAMMPAALDRMHADVAGRFGHEPKRRTTIEVMPDHKLFAVRITGMPWIHTMAACTGPVISLEVPREGAPDQHLGLFDWLEVLRHEYTHTITLDQTRNRIPHWLTEAAAVSMETKPRSFDTCQMLAQALESGELFDLDEINWAFVRPKRPFDRSLAYAQGHWMVEFMNERFGMDALPRLLTHYFNGEPEAKALPGALGIDRAVFYRDFLAWAREQVKAWGMAPSPTMAELGDRIRAADSKLSEELEKARTRRLARVAEAVADEIGEPRSGGRSKIRGEEWPKVLRRPVPVPDEKLDAWLSEFPDHPDLLDLKIRRRLKEQDEPNETTRQLLLAYQKARPVDPFPHRVLARWALKSGESAEAFPHLEALDRLEEHNNTYALELAKLERARGNASAALGHISKVVRIDPYNASMRELAAAIAIEAGDLPGARLHIEALTLIEPDRPQHRKRLERIESLIQSKG